MYNNLNAVVIICNNTISNDIRNTVSIQDTFDNITLKGNSAKFSLYATCIADLSKHGDKVIEKGKDYIIELRLEHIETGKYIRVLQSDFKAINDRHNIIEESYTIDIESLIFKPGTGDYRVSLLIKEKADNSWVEQTSTILTVKFE